MNCSETFSAGLASFHSHVVTQNTALGLAISAAPRVLRQSGGTAYKHTRRAFACAALLLAICVVAKQVSAQTYSETIENGGTVPSQQPAGPSNSFPLTNIENYSPYTGAMSLHIPLHHIGGRGDAGYDVVANIATHWSVTKTFYSTNGDVANVDITTDTWPNLQNQPLGIGVTNSFNYQGVCPQQTILGGQPYVTSSLPRYQIKRNDGSAATLRDQGLDGNASGAPGCSSTQSTYDAGRGSSAVTRDGSHVVFQLTSPNKILDSVIPINPAQSLAGTLIEPTGVRYQINGFGSVTSMEDRNGNQISFTPNSAGGYDHILYIDPSSLASVTDPLGRVTTFNMSSLGGTIQYPGYSNSPQIAVNSAMLSTVLRDDFKAQGTLSLNTLFPGVTPTNVFDQATISSIAYLDNSTYTFKYNQYGEIARVVLPTGGAIEYDFVPASSLFPGGLVGNLSDTFLVTVYRRLSVRRVYDANSALMGTTTYTWASENTTGLVTTETTTDAGGHILSVRTTHFSNDPTVERYLFPTAYPDWQWGRATKVEEGSPVARTTTYKWQPSPYTPVTWCGNNNCQNPPEADPEMYEQDVTLNDTSQQSKSMFGYDQYNNVTSDQEYDWGQGAPGSLLRKTINSYQGTPYTDTSHQLLHLLSLMQIFDGQGKLVAQTHFGYDESSPSGTPGIIGHDSNYDVNFNVRGNLTNPANCFNPPACTVYLNHGRQFDIAGNVTASSDANGKQDNVYI